MAGGGGGGGGAVLSSLCLQAKGGVGAAVLSGAANLWPYLPVKSIQVSESRAECAGGQLEGSTSGPPPPPGPLGVGGHLPVSSRCISSTRPLALLSATSWGERESERASERAHVWGFRVQGSTADVQDKRGGAQLYLSVVLLQVCKLQTLVLARRAGALTFRQ